MTCVQLVVIAVVETPPPPPPPLQPLSPHRDAAIAVAEPRCGARCGDEEAPSARTTPLAAAPAATEAALVGVFDVDDEQRLGRRVGGEDRLLYVYAIDAARAGDARQRRRCGDCVGRFAARVYRRVHRRLLNACDGRRGIQAAWRT
jgi:hypothetical protein